MRVGNYNVFKFLLHKGVSVLYTNQEGKTAIHMAIELEKLECLAYLFEGDSIDLNDFSSIMQHTTSNNLMNTDFFSKLSNRKHIWQSFQSLDYREKTNDYLPYHQAICQGDPIILRYLTKVHVLRDFLKFQYQKGQYLRKSQLTFDQIKEQPAGKERLTPLLLAASLNQYQTFMYLFTDLNCSIDALSLKRNNALHFAIFNKNIELIQKLVHLDSDYGILRSQKNTSGKSPMDLGLPEYEDVMLTIWDRVRQGNLQKIREYALQSKYYQINQQTAYLGNTPLNIALLTQQTLTIKTVLSMGADPLIKNFKGQSSIDLAIENQCSQNIMQMLKERIIKQNLSGVPQE